MIGNFIQNGTKYYVMDARTYHFYAEWDILIMFMFFVVLAVIFWVAYDRERNSTFK